MTRSEISVTITGRPGAGKSTIAEVIREALANAGISVVVDDDPEDARSSPLKVRVESFKKMGNSVRVKTVQRKILPVRSK